MLSSALEREIERLRNETRSGAVEIARQAAAMLPTVAGTESFSETLEKACRKLVHAQPTMAPLVNLANRALWESLSAGALKRVCEDFSSNLAAAGPRIAENAMPLIEDGCTALTYSASETVASALIAAHSAGRRFRVLCTESRPGGEGVALARRLGGAGIGVTVGIDASLFQFARRADVIVVGADAVSSHGVVNKIGTSLLAVAARQLGRRFYVLAGTQKVLPAGYDLPGELPRPGDEIIPAPPPNVSAENRYFDVTPIDWVGALITEEGRLPVWKVREVERRYDTHPALKGIGTAT